MGTLIALPFIGDLQATRAFGERFDPQDKSAEVTNLKKHFSLIVFVCVLFYFCLFCLLNNCCTKQKLFTVLLARFITVLLA